MEHYNISPGIMPYCHDEIKEQCGGNLKTLEPPTMKPAKVLELSKFAVYALFEILFLIEYHRTHPNSQFSSITMQCLAPTMKPPTLKLAKIMQESHYD